MIWRHFSTTEPIRVSAVRVYKYAVGKEYIHVPESEQQAVCINCICNKPYQQSIICGPKHVGDYEYYQDWLLHSEKLLW